MGYEVQTPMKPGTDQFSHEEESGFKSSHNPPHPPPQPPQTHKTYCKGCGITCIGCTVKFSIVSGKKPMQP